MLESQRSKVKVGGVVCALLSSANCVLLYCINNCDTSLNPLCIFPPSTMSAESRVQTTVPVRPIRRAVINRHRRC